MQSQGCPPFSDFDKVVVPALRLELPGFGVSRDVLDPRTVKVQAFDEYEVDLSALQTMPTLAVRVAASLSFTSQDWTRKTLHLDAMLTVRLEKQQVNE